MGTAREGLGVLVMAGVVVVLVVAAFWLLGDFTEVSGWTTLKEDSGRLDRQGTLRLLEKLLVNSNREYLEIDAFINIFLFRTIILPFIYRQQV